MHNFAGLDQVHVLTAASEHAERRTRADGFGISGKIGRDAVEALGSSEAKPEAGDDFIKDEQCAVLECDFTKEFKKAGIRRDAAAVAQQRFANNCRDFAGVPLEGFAHAFRIVPLRDDSRGGGKLPRAYWDGRAIAGGELFGGGVIALQNAIVPAVIVAFKLEELRASGGGAGQAKRDLNDFRAAVSEADTVGAGNDASEHLRDFIFQIVLRPKSEALLNGLFHRLDDFSGRIAEDVWTPGERVIKIRIAVHVVESCAAPMREVERMREGGTAQAAGDTSGQAARCALPALQGAPGFGADL